MASMRTERAEHCEGRFAVGRLGKRGQELKNEAKIVIRNEVLLLCRMPPFPPLSRPLE